MKLILALCFSVVSAAVDCEPGTYYHTRGSVDCAKGTCKGTAATCCCDCHADYYCPGGSSSQPEDKCPAGTTSPPKSISEKNCTGSPVSIQFEGRCDAILNSDIHYLSTHRVIFRRDLPPLAAPLTCL